MARVDLLRAKDAVEKAVQQLKEGLEINAASQMRFAIHMISDAMEKVVRRL